MMEPENWIIGCILWWPHIAAHQIMYKVVRFVYSLMESVKFVHNKSLF